MMFRPLFLVAFLGVPLAGCSVEDPPPFQEMLDQGMGRYLGETSAEQVAQDDGSTLYEFDPADGPMCLRGGDFQALTRPGTSPELMIYLQGGGACWSELCIAFETAGSAIPASGILDSTLAVNPVREWNVGYVPYCDGSLFVGDVDIDEDGDGTVDRYHRGLANLSAALDAIHSEFPEPPYIVLSGLSAGAYGTILAGAVARTVWPDVPIDLVADGGIGLGKPGIEGFITGLLEEWNIMSVVPESCDDCFRDGHATKLISWALDEDPTLRYAGLSSLEDSVISVMFLELSGAIYSGEVRLVIGDMALQHPEQYAHYIYAGSRHTTLALSETTDLGEAGTLPFDVGGSEAVAAQLEDILGRIDVTQIDGVTPADWLGSWLAREPGFQSLSD